jgi:hypothetical protein
MSQPRIYTYKVTFEEVPHWYWGVHKEKKFGELYLGSPTTNRWFWKFYAPKIQILEFFPFTDGGWTEARLVEQRLIRPDLNNSLCLNERCGGTVSMEVARKSGEKAVREKTGIHDPVYKATEHYTQYRQDNCRILMEEKRGLFEEGYLGSDGHREDGRKGGIKTYEEKKGLFAEYQGSDRHIKTARETGLKALKDGSGWFSPEAIAKRSQKIFVRFPDGREEMFPSIVEACKGTGLGKNTVKRLADGMQSGKTYKTKGFIIEYA